MLSQDFKEFIQSLNAREVRYLVIGGFAVAVHGHPRYTKDLDVWVEQTEENADRMIAALDDFGFSSLGLTREDFLRDHVIQLGYPPHRIDILTFANGLEFESSYAAHVTIVIEDTPVNFVGLDHLRQNKKSTGRHQDLADLEALGD